MAEFTRRRFLKAAGLAGAALARFGLALPGRSAGWPLAERQQGTERPLEPGRPRKRVIVVGAGLAGLVAAYELDRAGHDVTLLEAQLRPGGRVLTLRSPFSDGLYAEAGADRIPNTHDLTLRYARQFQLQLAPFSPPNGRWMNQIAGAPLVGNPEFPAHWPLPLTAAEQKLGRAGLWRKYVLDAAREIGNPAAPGWSPGKFAAYDSVTFIRFLRQRGASAAAVRVMTLGWDYDGVSALRVLAELAANGNITATYKIASGSDSLPRALAERLSDKIRYGATLRQVVAEKRMLRASYVQGNMVHQLQVDRLICTIPLPVLHRVEFQPMLSDEKVNAIDNAYYLSATRLFFQEERRFWAARGLSGFARSDWPAEVQQPTFDQAGSRGILCACLTGEMARRVASLPEDRSMATVLNEMETLFSGARENFEGGTTKSWNDDFWAKGAFQWFRPGQMIELWPHLATPSGRVHFGGEHTSPWPGWMQGAIHSGLRTAREVHEAAD